MPRKSSRLLEQLRHRWVLPFILGFLALLITGTVGVKVMRDFLDATDSLINTQNVKAIIRDTYILVQDAETSQRGYLITDDEKYLTDYLQALRLLQVSVPRLQAIQTEIEGQEARLVRFVELIADKTLEMQGAVSLVQENQDEEARAWVRSDVGRQMMNDIQQIVTDMLAAEDALLARLRSDVAVGRQDSLTVIIATLLISTMLIFSVYLLVGRNARENEDRNKELERAKLRLEEKVQERTATITRYARELERSNRELQDFAFVASHDLQEPLRKIRAFGDRLQTKYGEVLEGRGTEYITRMQSAAGRMSQLISDLLTYSRVFTRQPEWDQVPLAEVVEEVLDDLEVRIEETGARIEVGELPILECSRWQMKQLFLNLISNALKFQRGNCDPEVQITARKLSAESQPDEFEWYDVFIKDNGIGFDEQYLERIFSPFQRLHQRSEYEGTGIGLAVCRRIVERHDGLISAHSEPGEGAEFQVRLPERQPKQPLDPSPAGEMNGKQEA